jgi:hypothetical protein
MPSAFSCKTPIVAGGLVLKHQTSGLPEVYADRGMELR